MIDLVGDGDPAFYGEGAAVDMEHLKGASTKVAVDVDLALDGLAFRVGDDVDARRVLREFLEALRESDAPDLMRSHVVRLLLDIQGGRP